MYYVGTEIGRVTGRLAKSGRRNRAGQPEPGQRAVVDVGQEQRDRLVTLVLDWQRRHGEPGFVRAIGAAAVLSAVGALATLALPRQRRATVTLSSAVRSTSPRCMRWRTMTPDPDHETGARACHDGRSMEWAGHACGQSVTARLASRSKP